MARARIATPNPGRTRKRYAARVGGGRAVLARPARPRRGESRGDPAQRRAGLSGGRGLGHRTGRERQARAHAQESLGGGKDKLDRFATSRPFGLGLTRAPASLALRLNSPPVWLE